jgi:hypothetical protein
MIPSRVAYFDRNAGFLPSLAIGFKPPCAATSAAHRVAVVSELVTA